MIPMTKNPAATSPDRVTNIWIMFLMKDSIFATSAV
jgi:hypothetical protein